MASFPTSVKSFASRSNGQTIDAAHVGDLQDEVNALEDGYLNGTARLNSSNSTIANLSVSGNSTLGSTIAISTQTYIFPSSRATAGDVLTVASTSGSTATLQWRATGTPITLLRAASGTNTNAAATNVDTIAISGLTALDRLTVVVTLESATQQTAVCSLYNATDSVTILLLNNNVALPNTAEPASELATISQRQSAATAIHVFSQGGNNTTGAFQRQSVATFTTNWTGAWTLALRHGGVTAGGTFKYSWAVYKMAGQ